jgi:hypothetical protein
MFEYLFPIFCFGLAVTGIVAKGLVTAADMAQSQKKSLGRVNAESTSRRIPAASIFPKSSILAGPDRFGRTSDHHAVSGVERTATRS